MQTHLTALLMPTKKTLPSDDVLNALFERLIVSHTSKLAPLGVSDHQHAQHDNNTILVGCTADLGDKHLQELP